jgi:NAD(P)H-hydrate repair Nnr-like enzyme with NAD(P)H-hydrate epimerase domain
MIDTQVSPSFCNRSPNFHEGLAESPFMKSVAQSLVMVGCANRTDEDSDLASQNADVSALELMRRAAQKLASEVCRAHGRNPNALWDETGKTLAQHVLERVLRSVAE